MQVSCYSPSLELEQTYKLNVISRSFLSLPGKVTISGLDQAIWGPLQPIWVFNNLEKPGVACRWPVYEQQSKETELVFWWSTREYIMH